MRTRTDAAVKRRGRKEGRKEVKRKEAWISHVGTHTRNIVCKCVQSDGNILQLVVPALIPLFLPLLLFIRLSLAHVSLLSRGLSLKRAQTHKPFLRRRRIREATSQPASVSRSPTYEYNDLARSPGIISPEVPRNDESRVYGV